MIQTRDGSINWTECPTAITDVNGVPSDCGTLAVPLDYTDLDSGKKLNLTLIRIKAAIQPSKGNILINPGGPGIGGFQYLSGADAPIILRCSFRLVLTLPRGTGDTLPVTCYDPKSIYDQVEVLRSTVMVPALTNASSSALGELWAISGANAIRCAREAKDVLPLVSTAFTARDYIQVVDALGEDGMLRYWGHSYGTQLGATIAAMFPERIHRMVIDGVVNPHEYTDGWEYDPVPAGDLALEQFLKSCVAAGPDVCLLARDNATVASLTTKITDLLDEVRVEPILMGSNVTSELVGPGELISVLNNGFRIAQALAPYIAAWLDAVFRRNLTAYHAARAVLFAGDEAAGPFGGASAGISTIAIRCADSTFRADKLDGEVRRRVEKLESMSHLFGDSYPASYLSCARWKVKGKEQYTGDYKAKTKYPMFIIGSPYDLRTPLSSAKNVSAGFEGSVVLQHNGLGHTVRYSPGQCAINAVRAYFNNGTLPEEGTVCEPDFDIFSGHSLRESFLPEGLGNGTNGTAAKPGANAPLEFESGAAAGRVGWTLRWVVLSLAVFRAAWGM
ncbi:alpha/beta-hydrolase [Bimuria novae-zelandiae CBS 107.79]|uniref:Alpha/beta-hydrolase n=1 Tax=Bimuria novae-zelandiae CBS 107.79 TaxID=1447943 RepID=A0A6A5UWK7_9PLEO|nr:alpha/beta-hydrolase [Bimuria novae-zelandiae CBS 107.79]